MSASLMSKALRSVRTRRGRAITAEAVEPRRLLSTGTGLTAQYFNSTNLTSLQVVQTVPQVNFSWGNTAPATGVTPGDFSARFEGYIQAPVTGTYTFSTTAEDGVRLWIGTDEIINDWTDHTSAVTDTGTPTFSMNSGTQYAVKMEFYDDNGNASASLSYSAVNSSGGSAVALQLIPQAQLYPLTTAASYTATTVTSHTISPTTSGLPAGWSAADIGGSTPAGSTTYNSSAGVGGTFTVTGGGTLDGTANDSFQFVYQQRTGDFTLIARFDGMSDPNNGAEAGIEVRSGLSDSNQEFFIGDQPSGRTYFVTRSHVGESQVNDNDDTAVGEYPYLRIKRSGNQLVSAYSADDVNWINGTDASFIGSGTTLYAGLAVASRTSSATCVATFENVTFSNPVSNNITSEVGNSYVGGENHVPMFAGAAYVDQSTGELYFTGSDEDKGLAYINPDGSFYSFGNTSHYAAGNAVTEDANFVYDAHVPSNNGSAGVERYDHYGISIATAVLGSDTITGLAAGGGNVYIATDGLVYVFSASTFAFTGTCYEIPRAGNMAVDPNGNLWIVQNADATHAAQVGHYNSVTGAALAGTITFPSSTFTSTVVPFGIAVDLRSGATSGQVYVTDTGQLQQVHIFNSDGSYNHDFGDLYGIYGGAVPGAAGPTKLNFPVGVGLDSSGDIYVVNAGPPEQWGGTTTGNDAIIEKFTAGGHQLWERYSANVYDTATADPGNPTNVYERFSSFTLNASAGSTAIATSAATFTGTLVNPFQHPDDPRLVGTAPVSAPLAGQPTMSGESPRTGTAVRDIGGTKFLFDFDQHNSAVNVYRFVPGTNFTVFCDAIQVETNRYYTDRTCVWVDANGDGTRQSPEETFYANAPKFVTDLYVDSNGDVWMADSVQGVREFKVNSTTPINSAGALNYSISNVGSWTLPSVMTYPDRVFYDVASDTLYLTGFTKASPKPSSDTSTTGYGSGSQLLKFVGWVGGNNGANATPAWTTAIRYNPLNYFNNSDAWDVSGGYLFCLTSWSDLGIDVYSATTGALVTNLQAGTNIAAANGAETDYSESITVVQNNGESDIYAEDDEEARTMLFVWSPAITVPSTGYVAQDIGAPATAGSSSFDTGSPQTWTVTGSGTDIAGVSDQFQFATRTVIGDVQVSADLTSFTNTSANSKAGVMIRESNASNAAYIALLDTPGSGLRLQYRASDGAATSVTTLAGIPATSWVKLVRSGSSVTGFYSSDGVHWTQIGSAQTITMTSSALVGMSVCAASTSAATATFTNVSIIAPAVLTGLTPASSITYGTAATVLYGTISSGNGFPLSAETIAVTFNGVTVNAPIDFQGNFFASFNTSSLAVSNTPIAATYSYAGDANLGPISDTATTTLTVTPAPVNWTGTADGTNWSNPGNWSADLVPNQNYAVTIGTGFQPIQVSSGSYAAYNVSAATSVEIKSAATLVLYGPSAFNSTLTVDTAAKLQLATGATVLAVNGPNFVDNGTIDLGANNLVIHNGSIGTATILISSGFDQGRFDKPGLVSSVAAGASNHLYTLGSILNVTSSGTAIYSSFEGVAVGATDVLVKYTYYGDATLDGKVDGSDYSRVDIGFINHLTGWANGDFNYDGVINGSDYTLVDNAFNSQGSYVAAMIAAPPATKLTGGRKLTGIVRAGTVFSSQQIITADSSAPNIATEIFDAGGGQFQSTIDSLSDSWNQKKI